LKPTSGYRLSLCGDWPQAPESLAEKAKMLSVLIGTGGEPTPELFDPQSLLPSWFRDHCPPAFESPHLDAINRRANVWVRIQCNEHSLVFDEFRAQGWACAVSPDFPDAIC